MHIMEGFLPWQWCLIWWIIAISVPCHGNNSTAFYDQKRSGISTATRGLRSVHLYIVRSQTPISNRQLLPPNWYRTIDHVFWCIHHNDHRSSSLAIPVARTRSWRAFSTWCQHLFNGNNGSYCRLRSLPPPQEHVY